MTTDQIDARAIKLMICGLVLVAAYLARFRGSAWAFPIMGFAIFLSVRFLP